MYNQFPLERHQINQVRGIFERPANESIDFSESNHPSSSTEENVSSNIFCEVSCNRQISISIENSNCEEDDKRCFNERPCPQQIDNGDNNQKKEKTFSKKKTKREKESEIENSRKKMGKEGKISFSKKFLINKKGFLNEKGEYEICEIVPDKNIVKSCTELVFDLLIHIFMMRIDQGDNHSKQIEDIFSHLEKNTLKYEFENTLNISLSEDCYKENEEIVKFLGMNLLEYMEKMKSAYSFLQIKNKTKRKKEIKCGIRIINKLFRIYKAFHNEENKNKLKPKKQKNNRVYKNKSKNRCIKGDPDKLSAFISDNQPTYKNKLIIENSNDNFSWDQIKENINLNYITKRKTIRKDNLLLVLKKTLMRNFIYDFNKKNNAENKEKDGESNFYQIDEKKIQKYIKQEKNFAFFDSDFSGFVGRYKEDEVKKTMKESEEAKQLVKINKSEYLLNKIKEIEEQKEQKKQKDSIFQDYIDEKKKEIQNNKCKSLIFEFFKLKNLKGLILLLNCVKPEKQYYLKINNANIFKEAIIRMYGPCSFSIDLNQEEKKDIEDIKEQLNQLAKNSKCLSKKNYQNSFYRRIK